jgi:hypothetical protein
MHRQRAMLLYLQDANFEQNRTLPNHSDNSNSAGLANASLSSLSARVCSLRAVVIPGEQNATLVANVNANAKRSSKRQHAATNVRTPQPTSKRRNQRQNAATNVKTPQPTSKRRNQRYLERSNKPRNRQNARPSKPQDRQNRKTVKTAERNYQYV